MSKSARRSKPTTKHPLSLALTQGEARWLERRRAGTTQLAWRRQHQLSMAALRTAEADPAPLPGEAALDWPERLRLARRRTGLSIATVAGYLDVSRITLLTWERRGDARLIRFWSD